MDTNDGAGGKGTNLWMAKKKSGIHNLKRKYAEMVAKNDVLEEKVAELEGKSLWMVACVVLHIIRFCHI